MRAVTDGPTDSPDPIPEDEFLARLWQLGPVIAKGAPHSAHLGIRFVSVGLGGEGVQGRASLALPYKAELVGDTATGVMHGGAVTTLLDQCCGFAATAGFRRPVGVATLDLRIDYQRAARPKETVIAVAECYKTTTHIAFLRGIAHTGDESDPVATCLGKFIANPLPDGIDAGLEASDG